MDRKEALAQAKALVAQMTLEEKAAQLRYEAPAIPRLGIPEYNWWNEALHGVARAGTATVFPQAIGLAAVFDEDFHQRVAETIATEGRAKYNQQSAHGDRDIYKGLTFWSPNINIFRDPRWGRGQETYGEDPYLTSRLGVAFIRGLQGDGKYLKTAACAKHFAVHSGPEKLRHEFDAQATPKDMAETYLPAFEAAVKEAHVEAVMGAYNRVNGEPACGSKTLLKDTLRDKWGFEGHVVSDCWAIRDFHTHHMVTSTAPESAALAIHNGCDVNCGNTYLHMLEAYQEGLVTEEEITTACERLFTTRILLGLFADDCEYDAIPYEENDADANDALALAAAEKSMVLLENDGMLPLDNQKIRTLAVIGPNADSVLALEGNYNGTSSRYVTMLEGIRTYCSVHGIRVLYSQGSGLYKEKPAGRWLAEAKICAEQADAVIACMGLDATIEGEEGDTSNDFAAGDKLDLSLPACQQALMEALAATGKPLVTVILAGSALNVPQGNAKIMAWYPGQAGGTALARILFGHVSPSGRLPVTFYHNVKELPEFTDYRMTGRTYRYFTGTPLYPFGYGLSYVPFTAANLQVVPEADGAAVTFTLRNDGNMTADTVAQVYVHAANAPDATPNPILAAFKRVTLDPGEVKVVTLHVAGASLDVVNEAGERVREGSTYDVYAGTCQPDALSEVLTGTKPLHARVEL
ncbi:MAG: glycoside hydrolase family 3 C-terminal domain-containing protein [Clostridia bacterium]|nr:glycoside hydrolase family 3 C-terminal domain-containing protein [Clostridia bacterium]